MNLNPYDTIILDCDGVIFDSNVLKLNAFKEALKDYDESLVLKFIEHFKMNFGTSRYTLAKIFIVDFLKVTFTEELYNKILKNYSDNCVTLYQSSKFTSNFLDFILFYEDKKIFVASGSDQQELRDVFKKRDLSKFFTCVYGSPKKKSEIVKDIVIQNKNAVMVGDAESDMLAAQSNGIDFIFMRDYSTNEDMKNNTQLMSIANLGALI
jgi:HAD superfamily hydrolase (TIGR01549 family)